MLWDQHRERYEAGRYTIRRIPYFRFREITSCVSEEDMARIGRLNAKRESGVTLTEEETATLTEIASKWPIDDLRGACFIPPEDGKTVQDILDGLPRIIADRLEKKLDEFITPEIKKEDCEDPLAVALVATGNLGIDAADLTVGQGYAIVAMMKGGE
jgi:hypothetical protein